MDPYLLPNFHSVTDTSNSLNLLHNRFAFTSQFDFNGCGLLNGDICAKNNTIANFYAQSPTLPYFVNGSRIRNNHFAKNCLIYCTNKDNNFVVTTNEKNKIFGLLLEDNKLTKSETNGEVETKTHIYSANQTVSYGPFRYCTQKLCDLTVDEEADEDFRPIFELKVHRVDENESQFQSNSRNKIRFFEFNCGEDLDQSLNLFSELKIESLRRSDDSFFENCDRNELIDNQLLISYTKDNVIDLYDWETNQTIRSFDSFEEQIGLHWAQNDPKKFFNGDHKRLQYCDSRSSKTVLELFTKGNENLFHWEMFYEFLPSKLNLNEVFVATDLHIIVIDWRYTKQNLLQLNHMIPEGIIRSLKSREVVVNNKSTEILVASDYHSNCLMSFSSSPPLVVLSSNHLPLHLSNPKDIDKKFENYFYRGIEVIDSTDDTGFSSAVLTNSGDIFIQDLFWCTSDEEMTAREGEPQYKDRTYCSGVGSSTLELDQKTVQYMDNINNFLFQLKTEIKVEGSYVKECLNCTLHKVCRIEDDQCLCRSTSDLSCADKEQTTKKAITDRSAIISDLYQKHLGSEILDTKRRLEDKELLEKTSDNYTKSIFKVWDLFEKDQMDDT